MELLLAIGICAFIGWILAQLFPTPEIDHDTLRDHDWEEEQ